MIYLDYAANSPVDKDVLDCVYNASLDFIANPNSSHKLGKDASEKITEVTKNILDMFKLGMDTNEIIYTSGATESNNLAIKGIANKYKHRGKHIIVTELEHSSVLAPLQMLKDQGFDIDMVKILDNGLVDLEHFKSLIREDTILVSISYVDGELGLKQPIKEIAEIVSGYPNCVLHSDATQAVGKIDVDFSGVDLVSVSPHKFYGINGVGLLLKKNKLRLDTMIHGGNSTTIYRSGTPTLSLIASTEKALSLALENLEFRYTYVQKLNRQIVDRLKNYTGVQINSTENSIPFFINFSIAGVKSYVFAEKLEGLGICVSTKSACCPVNTMSRPVYAVTKDKKRALSCIRVSLSHLTTQEEIDEFLIAFDKCKKEL